MRALTALCSVYCAVGTKQAQRLQTVRLHDSNVTMTLRSGRAIMILVVNIERKGDDFRMGAESADGAVCNGSTIIPTVCNLTNHKKSGKHQ